VAITAQKRVCQGDIFKDIEYLEYADLINGQLEITKIPFPFVIVLTQDCDLESEFIARNSNNNDKGLVSVLLAPMYNAKQVYKGASLSGARRLRLLLSI